EPLHRLALRHARFCQLAASLPTAADRSGAKAVARPKPRRPLARADASGVGAHNDVYHGSLWQGKLSSGVETMQVPTIHNDPWPLRVDEDGVIRVGKGRLTLDAVIDAWQHENKDFSKAFPLIF